jgi:hypothetical protein
VTDIASLLHLLIAFAVLVTPIIVGVRMLEGPDPDLFAWQAR